MSYLIRVLFPDTPGSLGQLADAIGMVGANIQSVDIVENFSDGTVMDDIVVTLPPEVMADVLITAVDAVDGASVDSIRPFSGRVDRRGQIALLSRVAEKSRDYTAAMEEVVEALPKALTSTWAIVIDNTEPAHRVAWSAAAPEDDGSTPSQLNVTTARALNPEEPWIPSGWTLLDSAVAIAPIGTTGLVIAVGRTGGPDYLASEVEHIGNLGTILGAFIQR